MAKYSTRIKPAHPSARPFRVTTLNPSAGVVPCVASEPVSRPSARATGWPTTCLRDPRQDRRHGEQADSARFDLAPTENKRLDDRRRLRWTGWQLPRDRPATWDLLDPRRVHRLLAGDSRHHYPAGQAGARSRGGEARAGAGDTRGGDG